MISCFSRFRQQQTRSKTAEVLLESLIDVYSHFRNLVAKIRTFCDISKNILRFPFFFLSLTPKTETQDKKSSTYEEAADMLAAVGCDDRQRTDE
jgi:hypothetical protein